MAAVECSLSEVTSLALECLDLPRELNRDLEFKYGTKESTAILEECFGDLLPKAEWWHQIQNLVDSGIARDDAMREITKTRRDLFRFWGDGKVIPLLERAQECSDPETEKLLGQAVVDLRYPPIRDKSCSFYSAHRAALYIPRRIQNGAANICKDYLSWANLGVGAKKDIWRVVAACIGWCNEFGIRERVFLEAEAIAIWQPIGAKPESTTLVGSVQPEVDADQSPRKNWTFEAGSVWFASRRFAVSGKPAELLKAIVKRRQAYFSFSDICDDVWPDGTGDEPAMKGNLRALRPLLIDMVQEANLSIGELIKSARENGLVGVSAKLNTDDPVPYVRSCKNWLFLLPF